MIELVLFRCLTDVRLLAMFKAGLELGFRVSTP